MHVGGIQELYEQHGGNYINVYILSKHGTYNSFVVQKLESFIEQLWLSLKSYKQCEHQTLKIVNDEFLLTKTETFVDKSETR